MGAHNAPPKSSAAREATASPYIGTHRTDALGHWRYCLADFREASEALAEKYEVDEASFIAGWQMAERRFAR